MAERLLEYVALLPRALRHSGWMAAEGGRVVLTATLGRPLAEPLAVSWRIAPDDDPATPDADEQDYRSTGATTIPAGETTAPVEIAVVDDADIEPARERFVVALDEPETANVGLSRRAQATATIQEGVCDRAPAVRDALARGWRDCRWPRPADLARIPTLDLNARGIDALRGSDLLGLAGLERLDLRGNALAALPAGLLSHAPRLERLDLSANALEALPPGLFAGLRRLREVSVEDNPGAPFALTLELVRTDALGLEATVRFEVQVEFHWPHGPSRGWRSTLGNTTPDARQ